MNESIVQLSKLVLRVAESGKEREKILKGWKGMLSRYVCVCVMVPQIPFHTSPPDLFQSKIHLWILLLFIAIVLATLYSRGGGHFSALEVYILFFAASPESCHGQGQRQRLGGKM